MNARYRQLFPDDQAVKNMRPDQLEATSRDMNKEIHASALVAARSQTTLRTIEQNNTEARNILSRSEGNGSQVAQLQSAIQMLGLNWKLTRGSWVSTEPVLPGVWKRKESGHIVRARVMSPRTGKLTELWKVLPELTAAEALQWLEQERGRIRQGESRVAPSETRFSTYAVSLLERKIRAGDIKSQAGIQKWKTCLQRLFQSALAELFIEQMRPRDFAEWRDACAIRIASGKYKPVTMNTDLSVLRVVMASAKLELDLVRNPMDAVAPFDNSQHPAYTFEEPNSLTVDELREFLRCLREKFPRHYAMTFLGFALGKRPSTTRPLRRKGPHPDIHWETGVLLFRRSNTLGQAVMEGVKTGGEERVRTSRSDRWRSRSV